jgi:hypothetical protein
MNKEQQDIILDVYREHCLEQCKYLTHGGTIQEFIKKIKTDDKFSEKWGLKIEELELSTQERNEWFQVHLNGNNPFMKSDWKDFELDQQNIPTKLITLTYNNKILESYE